MSGFVRGRITEGIKARTEIRDAPDDVARALQEARHRAFEARMEDVRTLGDAVIACFFGHDRPRGREAARQALSAQLGGSEGMWAEARRLASGLNSVPNAVRPFHWEIEFPEAFPENDPGFDAIIGNPPFQGGTVISATLGMRYLKWLTENYPPCEHLCDLVAYFFRRSFDLLRSGASFGLVATNSISQGDTREGGLRYILSVGGHVYRAERRFKWPGPVAVVVSLVHVSKHLPPSAAFLDGHPVSRISAYLTNGATDESPSRLAANPYFSLGAKIYGQGFLFADGSAECIPIAVRGELVQRNPSLESRIRPYLGGEEILSHPEQKFHRWVILLSDIQNESDLSAWPELRDIVREKVKPGRDILGNNPNNIPLKRRWWAFQAHRPNLFRRLAAMNRVLVTSQVNPQFGFALAPANWVYSHKAVLFCIESYAGFAVIQSSIHEVWARFFSSTAMELLSYTPSDCFQTFPFPLRWSLSDALEQAGKDYYEFRANVLISNNQGITQTYNRLHSSAERSPEIARLREFHSALNDAVLRSYGWDDLAARAAAEFLTHDTEADHRYRGRFFWPAPFRDELLARLLDLNRARAAEERALGLSPGKPDDAGEDQDEAA